MAAAATPTIVFSHANGFPAGTYRVLFEQWRDAGWRVEAVEAFGHDPRYPVTDNWPRLLEELLAHVEARGVRDAVFVGHSLGGLLSLMAVCRRPELARGLVMLDSPVVTGWRAQGLRLLKASGLIERAGPGGISRRRRHEWPSRAAVHSHFVAKTVFSRWDPRVLADYVASGFVEREGRIRLAFAREIETGIYNGLPHTIGALLRRHPPRCPVGFIAGRQSVEMRQGGSAGAKALARDRFVWMDGGHLYPMERPDDTARAVLGLIERFGPAAGSQT